MKRSNTVYYEEVSEAYLAFNEGDDPLAYQEAMDGFVLPSSNEFLLRHLHSLSTFLDDIYVAYYERECQRAREEGEDRFALLFEEEDAMREQERALRDTRLEQLCLRDICYTLFHWHSDVQQRKQEMTGLYAVSYFVSWSAFVRAFHLMICAQSEKATFYAHSTVSQHPYCEMAAKRFHVKVSDAPIIEYSVGDLWNSMRAIMGTLYIYSFSLPMRNYIYALFLRYGDLLSIQQQDQGQDIHAIFDDPRFVSYHATPQAVNNDEMESVVVEEEEEAGSDDEGEVAEDLGVEDFDAFKKLRITVNPSYSLTNEFLFEGELIFYHQLCRIQLSGDLHAMGQEASMAITIAYTPQLKRLDFLKLALEQWYLMSSELSRDTYLNKTLMEQYTKQRIAMHLYHGDKERYKRQFPTSTCEARDVLLEVRPLRMTQLNETQGLVLGDLLHAFKTEYGIALHNMAHLFAETNSVEDHALQHGYEQWVMLQYEQEALLLTKLCSALFLELQAVSTHKIMKEAFILEELVSLHDIEEVLFLKRTKSKKKSCPLFVKLMRFYYVLEPRTNKLFRSLFFVEAYFVWLALALREEIVKEQAIHGKLLLLVKKLNTLIQC